MLTVADLNKKNLPVDGITDSNMVVLVQRMNKLEALYKKPLVVISGLRSQDQQLNLIKAGKTNAKRSKHLIGAAVDIADNGNNLREWLLANPEVLKDCCLWCEHWAHTPTWIHFQCIPPGSGNIWFQP